MRWKLIALAMIVISPAASAADMTFDDYWRDAHKPGVTIKEYPAATVITDMKNMTVYIFTKPGRPEHPGVIVRKLVTENGGTDMVTDGHSFGPDSAQPAFKAWMANPFASQ
jgi:hypothetical protein